MITKSLLVPLAIFLFATNSHAQWQQVDIPAEEVVALLGDGANLYAGTYGSSLLVSADNGTTWTSPQLGDGADTVLSFCGEGAEVFAGTYSGGIFRSTDKGLSWVAVNTGLSNLRISALVASGDAVLAGSWGGGVFRSLDHGATWTSSSEGLPLPIYINALHSAGSSVFLGANGKKVYRSDDGGASWVFAGDGFESNYVDALASLGSTHYAATFGDGVYRSTDNGVSWSKSSTGIPFPNVMSLEAHGGTLYAGTLHGVYQSSNAGDSWSAVGLTDAIMSLAFTDSFLVAGTISTGASRLPLPRQAVTSQRALNGQALVNVRSNSLTVRLANPADGTVVVEMIDQVGRRMMRALLPASMSSEAIVIPLHNVAAGVYFCRITSGLTVSVTPCIVR